jgi:hypothetical protein
MGYPDHGGFADCGVFVEDFFDFAWVDVVAAADNDVLFAVDDEVEAVVVT